MSTTEQQQRPVWSQRVIDDRDTESQESYAYRKGISVRTLSRIETGRRPSYPVARKIARGTGRPASFFLGEDVEEGEPDLDRLIATLLRAREAAKFAQVEVA